MKLLTTLQAAESLDLHRTRIWQLIKSGRLPAVQLGRDWFVKEQDLLKFKSLDRPRGRPKGVKK